MLGPTPPRRMSSSSTRKDNDTLCSCSASSCSENLPGKCIRWSVAMDPATSTDTGRTLLDQRGRAAAEAGAAGAAAGCVRIVDGETLLPDRVREVDRGTAEIRRA